MSLLEEGQVIRDTYEVERFLGEGAFAEVYRVKHRFLGRQAMKVFKRVGMNLAIAERPLILGADDVFQAALEAGEQALATYLSGVLQWRGPTTARTFAVMANNITSNTPFSTPNTPAGALYYRFVAAIDLSTTDPSTSNRGFKAANILLNGQVPMRARLTTYQ